MEKIKLNVPVVVEGKYDKIAVSSVIDAVVITTDGFGIFKSNEKKALIRRLSENGIIILCDSDGAGSLIRSFINGIIDKSKIYSLYTPQIKGREKRKAVPSKEGYLGVEGMEADVLRQAFLRLIDKNPSLAGTKTPENGENERDKISKMDFWRDGFSGSSGSCSMRNKLAGCFSLPENMTANALLCALNMICSPEEYRAAVNLIKKQDDRENPSIQ